MNIAIYSQSYSEMIDELKSRGRWGDYYLKESDNFCSTNPWRKIRGLNEQYPQQQFLDNKKAADENRENASVQEQDFLKKMSEVQVCILTWEGNNPLTFSLD